MADGEIKIIHIKESGSEIDLKVGDVVQIELESLGSGGYRWFLDSVDDHYVELVSEATKVVDTERIGAPVLLIWRFRALQKGSTEIRMSHYRFWEGREKATSNFHLRIKIH